MATRLNEDSGIKDLLEAGLKDPQWVAMQEAVTQKKMPIDPNITVENDLLLYKNR